MGSLVECVDCHKSISTRAEICPNCNSKDPHGIERRKEKFQMQMLIIAIIAAGVIGALWHFNIFDPIAFIKGQS